MGKIAREDRVVLRVEKYWRSRRFLKEFPSKHWSSSRCDARR